MVKTFMIHTDARRNHCILSIEPEASAQAKRMGFPVGSRFTIGSNTELDGSHSGFCFLSSEALRAGQRCVLPVCHQPIAHDLAILCELVLSRPVFQRSGPGNAACCRNDCAPIASDRHPLRTRPVSFCLPALRPGQLCMLPCRLRAYCRGYPCACGSPAL